MLPNSLTIMAVVVYYINKAYKNRTCFIILRRLHGNHLGENITKLVKLINNYSLKIFFRYFVIDNLDRVTYISIISSKN